MFLDTNTKSMGNDLVSRMGTPPIPYCPAATFSQFHCVLPKVCSLLICHLIATQGNQSVPYLLTLRYHQRL